MPNHQLPWDQILARIIVKQLVRSPITPNQITYFSLLLAICGSILLTVGKSSYSNCGVLLFIFARFLDHLDGELARQKEMKSKIGYYLDYIAGGISYGTLFICLGIGFQGGFLGNWSIIIGLTGCFTAVACVFLNLKIDEKNDQVDPAKGESIGYPMILGFELEDGIYLMAPIAWLGWLEPFFISAGIGAAIYGVWTLYELTRLK